jgi:outer membrane protein, heavy metal efflux system
MAVRVFLLFTACALSAGAQSVDEFVERALANNRDYLASVQRVKEAEAMLRRAGVRPAPALEFEGGSARLLGAAGSREFSVAYLHPLETGGKRTKRQDVARFGLELARAEADEKKRQLTFEVRQRVAEALKARRRLTVLIESARVNEETLRLVAARVEEGDAAPLEKRLLETDLSRAEVDRVAAESRLEIAVLELRRIGASAESGPLPEAQPEMPPLRVPEDELVRRALESRADLRALRAAEEQARSGVLLSEADSLANVNASARYSHRSTVFDQLGFDPGGALTPVRDRDNVLTLGISVPLFSGRKNQANVEASVSREHEARLRREYLAAAIPSEVKAVLRRWDAARRTLELFDVKILRGSEQNLLTIRQAWQLGQLRFLDVLSEQRRVLDLRMARVDAESDLLTAWAELEYALGADIQ